MIEAFRKIWQFSGKERGNINKSVGVSVVNALLQMCQVGAIYLVVLGLTGGSTAKSVAVLALVLVLVSIFGGAVASNYSKQLQTHAGYFMAADRRISIADKLKSVPMGYFNESSLGQLSGVCTSVVGAIESMVPMVLVNILGGLITTAVFTVIILLFDWRIGLIVLAGILVYLAVVSAMEKKSVAIAAGTQKSQADLTEAVLENVQGMSVIKSFNLSGRGDKKTTGCRGGEPPRKPRGGQCAHALHHRAGSGAVAGRRWHDAGGHPAVAGRYHDAGQGPDGAGDVLHGVQPDQGLRHGRFHAAHGGGRQQAEGWKL